MLDRIDSEEINERAVDWLRRYGWTIVAGVILAILLLVGLDWWKNSFRAQTEQLAVQLEQLDAAITEKKFTLAKQLYAELEKDNGVYGGFAALSMGMMFAQDKDYAAAQTVLNKAQTSSDTLIAQTARWQLAQLQIEMGEYDAALQSLQQLENSIYENQIRILRGDIYRLRGDINAALAEYEKAQEKLPSALLLQLKTEALKTEQAVQKGVAKPQSNAGENRL